MLAWTINYFCGPEGRRGIKDITHMALLKDVMLNFTCGSFNCKFNFNFHGKT